MFRIVKNPPSAYIGETPICLIDYSENLESVVEAPLGALRGTTVNQYPPMLQCTVIFDNEDAPEEIEWCNLHHDYAENDIDLNFHFGSSEGIWKKDVAIGAAYRELTSHADFKKFQSQFDIEMDDTSIFFSRGFLSSSNADLYDEISRALQDLRVIVDAINEKLFGFRWKQEYEVDEPLFTKEVVIPLLRAMGFEAVRYNHGVTEYGRDVLFADIDKFARIRHYAAQVKAGPITASNATLLQQLIAQIDDAFAMPVKGPGKAKQFHVSEVLVICSGRISEGAVERLNQKIDARLAGSIHFLDIEDIRHLAQIYLRRQ